LEEVVAVRREQALVTRLIPSPRCSGERDRVRGSGFHIEDAAHPALG
jgi:hypothetical protein